MGYALSGGFFYGGAYAFIVGTPFAYIDYYHVSPQAYGWLFGLNIVGMMVANFVNRRLLERFGSERLFHIGTWILALTGIVLAINARFGWGGLPGLVVPIFFYMSMNGLIVANSVAGALSAFAHKAGSASSLLGGDALRQRHPQRGNAGVVLRWHPLDDGLDHGAGRYRQPGDFRDFHPYPRRTRARNRSIGVRTPRS
ncbi:hypothetical protein ACFS3C_16580 [Azotobacter vinelandii]